MNRSSLLVERFRPMPAVEPLAHLEPATGIHSHSPGVPLSPASSFSLGDDEEQHARVTATATQLRDACIVRVYHAHSGTLPVRRATIASGWLALGPFHLAANAGVFCGYTS